VAPTAIYDWGGPAVIKANGKGQWAMAISLNSNSFTVGRILMGVGR